VREGVGVAEQRGIKAKELFKRGEVGRHEGVYRLCGTLRLLSSSRWHEDWARVGAWR
jgi:hypothetical protein